MRFVIWFGGPTVHIPGDLVGPILAGPALRQGWDYMHSTRAAGAADARAVSIQVLRFENHARWHFLPPRRPRPVAGVEENATWLLRLCKEQNRNRCSPASAWGPVNQPFIRSPVGTPLALCAESAIAKRIARAAIRPARKVKNHLIQSSDPNNRLAQLKQGNLGNVEAIEVHHLAPRSDEVLHKHGLCIVACIDFSDCPELGV